MAKVALNVSDVIWAVLCQTNSVSGLGAQVRVPREILLMYQ